MAADERYGNSEQIEMHWAIKAYEHAETYENLIQSVDPRHLKLSAVDDEIYAKFRQEFPDMILDPLDEDTMKSKEGKEKWRVFCDSYKGIVDDYNAGDLVRVTCKEPFSQHNSVIVVRSQFLAIEIARNREGFNDNVRKTCKACAES